MQAILENNVLFFNTLSTPRVVGAWAFSFIFSLEENATVADEVFVSTATAIRSFTLVAHRIQGRTYSSTYMNGTISRGAISGSGAVGDVADNAIVGCAELNLQVPIHVSV